MIEDLIAQGLSEDEIVKILITSQGWDEVQARFMYGIVAGTIPGDAVQIDGVGNETALPSRSIDAE